MTDTEYLIDLADRLLLTHPKDAARLLQVTHDFRQLQKLADSIIGDAMEEARAATIATERNVSAALERICKGHHGR